MDPQNEVMNELQRSLGRVEGQLSSLNEKVDRLISNAAVNSAEVDSRLETLESWRTRLMGAAAVVAFIVSAGVWAVSMIIR